MRLIYALLAVLIPQIAQSQTYSQMQWGMNNAANPYGIGIKLGTSWFDVGSISSTGNLSWVSVQDNVAGGSYFGVPNAKFDGVTDDTAAINSRISNINTAGGGTLYLPSGTAYLASPILLKSHVKIVGASNGTTFSCVGVCVGQASNSFVSQAQLINVNLSMRAGNTSDAILLTSVQDTEIGGIKVFGSGFRSVLSIISAAATGGTDNIGGNTIFNTFRDIDAWGALSTYGVYVAGRYGTSAPLPAQVATVNEFRNIKVYATNACFDFVKAADSNTIYNPTCRLGQTGGRAYVDADDPAYSGVNNYVNNQRYYAPIISVATVGAYTYFTGNWTFGVEVYGLLQDVNPVTNTITPVNYGTASSYCIRGQNIRSEGVVSNGNLLLGDYCKGYYGKDSWINTAVSEGFNVANTVTSPYNYLLLQPATELTQGTINLPCGSPDSALFAVNTLKLITRVTLTPCSGDNISIGANPFRLAANQTIKIKYLESSGFWVSDSDPPSINGNLLDYVPTTGFSLTSAAIAEYSFLLINPVTDLASGTVNLPCNRDDSDEFTISTLKRITALTITGCASPADSVQIGTGKNPFWIDAGGTVTLTYVKASSTWVPKNTSSNLGVLAVAGGGTGLSQGTSGGVPYFSGSSTLASSAALGATQVVLGGGAGAAPYTVSSFTSDNSGNVAATSLSATTRVVVAASLPTISSCGTSPPAATAGSSNNAGQFTLGTATPTACTITFAAAYATHAYCTVTPASNYTGTYYISSQSNTSFTVTLGTGTDSVVFNYTCFGN